MEFSNLLHTDWFIPLQSIGIIVGLFFNAIALVFSAIAHLMEVRSNQAANLLEVTKQHREIWTWVRTLESKRIMAASVDLNQNPLTDEENLAVHFLILHLAGNYRAAKAGMFKLATAIPADIRQFFSNPLVSTVWETVRQFHEKDFVSFVEWHRAQ
jgi:hypothetical protein